MRSFPDQKSFTLLELTITISVVTVLAGLAISKYFTVVDRARAAEGIEILRTLYDAQVRYFAANAEFQKGSGHPVNEDGEQFRELREGDLDVFVTPSEYFRPPTLWSDTWNRVAKIRMRNGNISFYVCTDGTIMCQDLSPGTNHRPCRRLGFDTAHLGNCI